VTGSIGIPIPDTEAKIMDLETGDRECRVGEVGELIVRGPQVMQGYWGQPELTEKILRKGWLYTGDLAKTDENGYFYIVDRKDDLIISSGFNIYPTEIEDTLLRHSGIKAAAVVGEPDKIRGQAVKAFVVPAEGEELTREGILSFCRDHLSEYQVPRSIVITETIPMGPTGKPLRRALRES
jgi:long-chain acyl-CoA synthetase